MWVYNLDLISGPLQNAGHPGHLLDKVLSEAAPVPEHDEF